ncbi:MAG: fibronectin type III domain-containing protein [Ruminococcus sp.]|nr:fibronectin type III domain-containing protein [Ruminococcus sp.]
MVDGIELSDYTAKTDISKATVKVANKTYTGKALKPAPTVTLDGKTLKKGTDYTVSYKNNVNCGKASVTVTGIGKYTGSKTANFIIKPAKVASKKLTSPKTKQVKLTWTKAKGGVTGYQIVLGLNKKMTSGKKTVWVKKAAAAAKTVKGLKAKKTYYAKVRAYKQVGSKKYYGAWSTIRKAKCK